MSLGLSEFREDATPLLRHHQVEDLKQEAVSIERMLKAPAYISNAIDKGAAMRRLRNVRQSLEQSTPRPYAVDTLDAVKRRSDALLVQICEGMPTQAEMRRNPVGAVDKHRRWERRNKAAIKEWRNIQYRLHAGSTGADDSLEFERDIGSIERFRPNGGAGELNLDIAQIPGKDIHLPPPAAGPVVVFSDAELGQLKALDAKLHARIAALPNEVRAEVLGILRAVAPAKPAPAQAKPARKAMSPAARKAAGDRLRALNASRLAAKAATTLEQEA